MEADAEDFQLDSIEITSVSSSISIDDPDVNEMTGDMKTLSESIAEINDGVAGLKEWGFRIKRWHFSLT